MSLIFEINRFGPIRKSKIEFKPLLIFSGQSNTGKSYLAFLIYYVIKHISEIELMPFINENYSSEIKSLKSKKNITITIEPTIFNKWLNDNVDAYMKYLLNSENIDYNGKIIAKFDKFELNISYYEELASVKNTNILSINNEGFYLQSEDSIPIIILETISEELTKRILNTNSKQTLLLPPSKSALINFSPIIDESVGLGMYKEFLKDFTIIKERNIATEKRIPHLLKKHIESFINNILEGKISEISKDLFYSFNNTTIPISAAASSIKELAPFIIAINKYHPSSLSILYEEPESHLHPQMQIELAKLISILHNYDCFFQITTHSDLFLSQINNLIRLNNLKTIDKKEFDKFCTKYQLTTKHTLSIKKIGAYLFKKDKKGNTNVIQQDIRNGISLDSFDNEFDNIYSQTNFLDNLLER